MAALWAGAPGLSNAFHSCQPIAETIK